MKARAPITKKQFVIMQLRRVSYKWGPRNESLSRARISRGFYRCAMCGPLVTHPRRSVNIDHIEPVVPITGFENWDSYIDRLFCDVAGFQILCSHHHDIKTKEENAARKAFKDVMEGRAGEATPFKKKRTKRSKKR